MNSNNYKILEELDNGDVLVLCDDEKVIWDKDYLKFVQNEGLENAVFTHNCGLRLVCGRLGTIASRMALDDNQATVIDGTRKGAGIVKSQGEVAHIQYYYTEQKWIKQWFKERGLTERGYMPNEDPEAEINPDDLDFGEDEDLSIDRTKTEIEFANIHKEIDHTQDQKFREV